MEPIITSDVVVAYSQCPRKAYLLMFSPDQGEPHEYVKILEQERCENQERYIDRLKQKHTDIQPYDAQNLREGREILVNARLQADGLEAGCSVLTRVDGKSALGKHGKGECLDNAVAERFFGSLKRERTSKRYYVTRQEARDDIIDYIEMFSNSWRKHSYLGYVSPNAYEKIAWAA